MGFFDKVLSAASKARDVMEDVQKLGSQVERTVSTFAGNETVQPETAEPASATGSSPNGATGMIEEETVLQAATDNCRPVTNIIYDGDVNGQDYEITQSFLLRKEFHAFDSGAGEVDASYGYSPRLSEEDWCDWNIGDPYVAIVFFQAHYDIVKQYETNGTIPAGTTLAKVKHPLAVYKTTNVMQSDVHVCYHFHRGCDAQLYYQFEACYPVSQKGQEMERIVLEALQTMVDTYKEDKKPE